MEAGEVPQAQPLSTWNPANQPGPGGDQVGTISASMKPRVACIIGTRPDSIKTAPVILKLHELSDVVTPITLSTGQHREMLDQVLDTFQITPDEDLGLMRHGQSLSEMSARALQGLDEAFKRHKPDFVMAQGDTTTTFIASLAAFYNQIPYGHIEAGLRTHDINNPFPEEYNRRAAALVSAHHYAPTDVSAENLRREGFVDNVFVTGNTGIDAVLRVAERVPQTWAPDHRGRVILLTTHRRENWGEPQREIARAARRIVDDFPDTLLIVAMHRNPVVRESLVAELSGHERIQLIEPPEYASFVKLMQRADLILSDSGGVQEEAPAFGIPVLVLRDTTERPEGVTAGASKLVGARYDSIVSEAVALLAGDLARNRVVSPYGDGKAADRICAHVLGYFGIAHEPVAEWDQAA